MNELILVTGANGYVGSRLTKALLAQKKRVRAMMRRRDYIEAAPAPLAEWVVGDALDKGSLDSVLKGITTAYYLIHSMGAEEEFAHLDRQAASNFAEAAKQAGVSRIVFLGGLGVASDDLSTHLKSRQETGLILASTGVQVIELRAAIIIGAGSLSFELIRSLVERLPVMVTPKWVGVKTQPIYIGDVIKYLLEAAEIRTDESHVFEIGGPDVYSYRDLMDKYARLRKLHRLIIPVPFLTPRLSSLWLQFVTPIYARVGRKLIASLSNRTLVRDKDAERYFSVKPIHILDALQRSESEEQSDYSEVRWADVDTYVSQAKLYPNVFSYGHRLYESQLAIVKAPREQIFAEIASLGGKKGWPYANWLWVIRGAMDTIFGGVGLRRGRRHPTQIQVGDAVDFFRVQKIVPNEILLLYAEMRLPGRAWLQFELKDKDGATEICQTATFDPKGLFGLVYWYGLLPVHLFIFNGLLKSIVRRFS